jgi:hypothetical protein
MRQDATASMRQHLWRSFDVLGCSLQLHRLRGCPSQRRPAPFSVPHAAWRRRDALLTVLPWPGLLCLKTAREGGASGWTSSISIHNELLRLGRRDLVETLAGDLWV